ncbi:unnamed protein product, partial [Ectocarpus sp. 12 AP-2014]
HTIRVVVSLSPLNPSRVTTLNVVNYALLETKRHPPLSCLRPVNGDFRVFFAKLVKAVQARKLGKAQENGGDDGITASASSSNTPVLPTPVPLWPKPTLAPPPQLVASAAVTTLPRAEVLCPGRRSQTRLRSVGHRRRPAERPRPHRHRHSCMWVQLHPLSRPSPRPCRHRGCAGCHHHRCCGRRSYRRSCLAEEADHHVPRTRPWRCRTSSRGYG